MSTLLERIRDARSAVDVALTALEDGDGVEVALALIEAQGKVDEAEERVATRLKCARPVEAVKWDSIGAFDQCPAHI